MKLTPRELEVCECIVEGLNNNEIAAKLFISKHRVKTYVSQIMNTLNAKNRTNVAYILGKENIINL